MGPESTNKKALPERLSYFDPEKLGQSLVELDQHPLSHAEGEFFCKWLGSRYEVNIILWYDQNDTMFRQQVVFWGQTVEWSIIQGCMTGILIEEEVQDQRQSQVRMQIRFDSKPNPIAVQGAIAIIEAAAPLVRNEKDRLIRNFRESPVITEMSNQDIMKLLKIG